MSPQRLNNIVVVGGGTGTHTVLSGLKKHVDGPKPLSLSAIITVADSGGSTGRLRDEFGRLPVGDFRVALSALADSDNGENLLRDLFLYRFEKGQGLSGHNFGNLFLVALSDLLGSEEKAIAFASKMLRVRGSVIPVADTPLSLKARYEDGTERVGETHIDEPPEGHDGTLRITALSVEPDVEISERARDAIRRADAIILGPGGLYTSVLPNIVVRGMREALSETPAKIVTVVNLMSWYGQTHGLSGTDHTDELARYAGREPDYILVNSAPLPESITAAYAAQNEFPVPDNFGTDRRVIRDDLLASEEIKKTGGDVLKRSLIRHDPDKLARAILSLL